MKLELSNKTKVGQLVTIFRNIKTIVQDANINISETGCYIQSMDSSHVCLAEIKIDKEWFDLFDVEIPEVLGVNCEMLFKVIDCWKEGQKITIYTKNGDKLFIDFEGENTITKRYALPLMNIEAEIMTIPDTEYQVDMTLRSDDFKEIIGEMVIFNDELQIMCTDEKIMLKADGDVGEMIVEIKEDDILEYCVEEECDLSVKFSIRYINAMCAFSKLNCEVYIHCSEDKPLKMHYSLDESNSEESQNFVRFFIAPKMDDD
jgi:proliferating cell nuclear antigen PCNA